jgi:hypothetical protein
MNDVAKRPTQGGGARPSAGGILARGPARHRQGPVGLGTTHFNRCFITDRLCEPVIYEWKGGRDFAPKLTWPQRGRNFYRKGDIFLFNKLGSWFAGQMKGLLKDLAQSLAS